MSCLPLINCGDPLPSFLQLLASCVVTTTAQANCNGLNGINAIINTGCGGGTPVITCNNQTPDYESVLASTFVIDIDGNLAWNIVQTSCDLR